MAGVYKRVEKATIPAGDWVSNPVSLADVKGIGVVFPSAMTNNIFYLQVSDNSAGPFVVLQDPRDLVSQMHLPMGQDIYGKAVPVDMFLLHCLRPWRFARLTTGGSFGTEAAQRVFEFHLSTI